jgi:hypothetical protein
MRKPDQLAEFAKAGFRTEGGTPPQSDVTNLGQLGAPLSVGDASMRATLANAVTTPGSNPAITIMLDQSMPEEEGGKTRLANVVTALNTRLQALSPNSVIGLWTFDGSEGRSEVTAGPLADQVGGQPRSEVLNSTLAKQSASGGGAVSFTTMRMLYTDALANFHDGHANSVLLITTGPHTDQSLDATGLQNFIKANFDPAKPVAVDVIDFGQDSDRATWEAISQVTGGSYQNVANSDSPELTTAITAALS